MLHNSRGLARLCNANDLFFSGRGLECGNCGAWEETIKAGHFVVVGNWSFDKPPKMYYQIKEFVTPDRKYIILPEIYSTADAAIVEIERMGG
jgi:hypothetical protein